MQRMNEKRIGAKEFAMLRNFRGWGQPDRAVEQMLTGEPYPIKACWIQTTNILGGQAANTRMHYDALKKMDFNVVVDLFPNPTIMAVADLILPAASIAEISAIGKPVALEASADERDVLGLISITTTRPVLGLCANCIFVPPMTCMASTIS